MKPDYVQSPLGALEDMYDAYNETIIELAEENDSIVLLYVDFGSGKAGEVFREHYPNRIYDFGIAEANTVSVAAGLAAAGKTPFYHGHSVFGVGRAYNQIRQNIAYDTLNVKLILCAAGTITYLVGSSHQTFEDTAALRVIPNLVVMTPADAVETRAVTKAAAAHTGPVAVRLARTIRPAGVPTIYRDGFPFEMGKAVLLSEGTDITIIGSGIILADCLRAVDLLAEANISVRLLDMHTVKPIDEDAILKAAKETGRILTVEDVSVFGGLGGAVSEVVSTHYPVPVKRVGIRDRFGQTGTLEELKIEYEISVEHIADAARTMR